MSDVFTYDGLKDIWIPAIGAIAIPVTIAFFTWWFGASRAERQKEINELRDNLNLLLSILYTSIEKFLQLRQYLQTVVAIENRKVGCIAPDELTYIFTKKIAENFFEIIKVEKYASCIIHDKNFVINLIILKNIMQILHQKLIDRNEWITRLGPLDEFSKDVSAASYMIHQDYVSNVDFIYSVDNLLLKCKALSKEIEKLGLNFKGLKLNTFVLSDKDLKIYEEIRKEYDNFEKQGLMNVK